MIREADIDGDGQVNYEGKILCFFSLVLKSLPFRICNQGNGFTRHTLIFFFFYAEQRWWVHKPAFEDNWVMTVCLFRIRTDDDCKMKTYFQLFPTSRRIKLNLLLTSCKKKKKIIYSFCFYIAKLNVKSTFCPHTQKICMYWLVVLSPKRSSYTSVLQYKSSYYLNNKEALSGLLAVPFAND